MTRSSREQYLSSGCPKVKLHIRGRETHAKSAGRYSTITALRCLGMTSAAAEPSSCDGSAARAFHVCPLCRRTHQLCTAPPPRKTQSGHLRLHTLRTLIQQNVWNNCAGDSPDVEWLDVLSDEDPATLPPRPPWRAPTWALPVEGAVPTIYVPHYKYYDDAPRGSPLPLAICQTVRAPSPP